MAENNPSRYGCNFLWHGRCFFFPKRLYIHYNNPTHPVEVRLNNYDQTRDKVIVSNGVGMMIIKRPLVETMFSRDLFAMIHWSYTDNKSWIGRLDMIGEEGQPDLADICRLDIYLDNNAKFIRYEETGFLFLNFCW